MKIFGKKRVKKTTEVEIVSVPKISSFKIKEMPLESVIDEELEIKYGLIKFYDELLNNEYINVLEESKEKVFIKKYK